MTLDKLKVGQKFSGVVQIRSVSLRETKGGDPYVFIKAGDITGDIMIKVWSVNKELADILVNNAVGGFLELNELLIGEYQGNLELTSRGGRDVKFVSKEEMEQRDDFDIQDYTIGAPFKMTEMLNKIEKDIDNEIVNDDVQRLVKHLWNKYNDKFKTHPAAISIHHDYEEGLLFHTYNMLQVGKSLCKFYPVVNKSLLLAGIILHDMGKIIEYSVDEETGGYDYSTEGSLIGHISLMSAEIQNVGRELGVDEEVILNLMHLVLSHHGNLEWGSPVVPKTPEAIMLHHIDSLDSKMEQVRSAFIGVDKGEHTNRIFGLGNIQLYNPNVIEEDKETIQIRFDDLH